MIGKRQIVEIDGWDGSQVVTKRFTITPTMEGTTNLAPTPTAMQGWSSQGTSLLAGAAIAPDGTPTATKVTVTGGSDPFIGISATTGTLAGRTFTWSVWAWTDQPNGNAALYIYDASVTESASISLNITSIPQRFSITKKFGQSVSSTRLTVRLDIEPVVTVGKYLYCWGGQIEEKSHPTPFVDIYSPDDCVPSLIDPGLVQYSMFTGGKTSGASTYSFGEVVLNNADRSLDTLRSYNFDGRAIRMYEGDVDFGYPFGYTLIYSATVDSVAYGWDNVTFAIKGKQKDLDVKVPAGTFAGTNVGPAGVEGGDSLKGKDKPFLLGRAYGFSPVLCNSTKWIYAVSPATGVDVEYMGSLFKVYDNGIELVYEGTYTSQSDMENNPPTAGRYKVWPSGGYFRLHNAPAGDITCDAVSKGRAVTARPGNLIADLLTLASITYDSASIAALNSAFTGECGVFATGWTISAVLDKLCAACGAYWYFTPANVLKVGQLVDPSTLTAEYSLSTVGTAIHRAEIQKTQDTKGGIPAHTITLLRGKNYSVQTSPAGAVPSARKEWLKEEWRKTQVVNAAVKTAHPLSEEMVFETPLTKDNAAEATRRAGLYSVQRDLAVLELSIDAFGSTANVRPGMCVSLDLQDKTTGSLLHRYSFSSKKMILVAFAINRVTERINATFWG